MVGVVAERDRIDPGREQLIGGLWRDPQSARDVLAVDHDEDRVQTLAQDGQALEQRASADAPDEVANEQDAHRRVRGPRRLGLSHTLAMVVGGR